MRTIRINTGQEAPLNCPLTIGVQGENMALQIVLDFSAWQAEFGAGAVSLAVRRSGDAAPYPVLLNQSGTEAAWNVTNVDTAIPGTGLLQYTYTVGETAVKTKRMSFVVMPSLEAPGEVPDPYEDWLARLQTLSEETQQNASSASASAASAALAASHYPRIIGGEWYVWSVEANAYVSTGIAAQGEDGYSPTVQVTSIEGGHRVTITDADGAHTFDVMDGQGGAGAVESVNGKTGEVTLDASDVGALPSDADLDDIPDGSTYKRATAAQLAQIATNANDIDAIEEKIPSAASASNQLADKAYVADSIIQGTAIYRGAFASYAALMAVAWQTTDPDAANYVSNNDYAYVLDDETHDDECWRYLYVTGTGWTAQIRVNETPFTQAQLDAINSGATAAIISSVADKYVKPSGGIPASDLASAVQTSLGKADTALQSVPNTYRTAAAQDVIDAGKQPTVEIVRLM